MSENSKSVVETNKGTNSIQLSPAQMILEMSKSGIDVEKMKSLLELQKEWESNEARKAYHKAMAEFKANPPKIEKDKSASFGTGKAAFKHASLANVCEKINSELSKHGLSASWTTKQNGSIVVTCKITHELGHSEETSLSAQSDTSGNKNSIQAIGSTITYLERYTLLAITGLATTDQDDDGNSVDDEKISEKELHSLHDQLIELNANETVLLKALRIENLENMTKEQYKFALHALDQRRKELKFRK